MSSVDTGGERPPGDRSALNALRTGLGHHACGVKRTRWTLARTHLVGAAPSFFVFAKANARRPIVQTYEDLHRCRLDVAMAMEREVLAVRT